MILRLLAIAALTAAAPALAQVVEPNPVPTAPPEYRLAGTEVHRIRSAALGREYDIFVSLPPGHGADPARRYPVIYLTDAGYAFPLVRAISNRMRAGGRGLEPAIIVGLSYAVGETGEYSRRRDYTPTPHGDVDAVSDMPGRPVVYGGADAYRQFIAEEVFPFVEQRFQADPSRRIYVGHSYGGLFGAHVLLSAPETFQRYVLISPSLWYGRGLLLARERGYTLTHKDLKADVFLLIGADETTDTPSVLPESSATFDMVGDMVAFASQLRGRGYPGLRLRAEVIPGEDHLSVYPAAITRGLKWAIPPQRKTAEREIPNTR